MKKLKKILSIAVITAIMTCSVAGCGKTYTDADMQSAYNQGYEAGYADANGNYSNAGNTGNYNTGNVSAQYNQGYEEGYADGYADCKDGYAYEDAYFGKTDNDVGYGNGYYDGWHDCYDGY